MNTTQDQLRAIFSASGWSRFIASLRDYRDKGKPFPAAITLRDVSDEERRHLARLLRLQAPSQAGVLRYDLAKITSTLEAMNLAMDWDQILTLICGDIPKDKLAALAAKREWQHFWPYASKLIAAEPFPCCDEWLNAMRQDGTLKRLAKGDANVAKQWFDAACGLLRLLPLPEEMPLASAAAKHCRNSHVLDPNMALSTIVLRGLALRQQRTTPSRSDERRELWSEFGIICDDLSAPVLAFNLGLTGDTLLCKLIAHFSEETQPLHVTSRLLWATDWNRIVCPPVVYVCENPTIISVAANQLGKRCPPLVCVNGEPKTAARLLLRNLRKGGAALRYHGDFDWPGIAIAARIFEELEATPWCFDAEAYVHAAKYDGRPLIGKPVPTPWSPALCEAMHRTGTAYDEELLANELLATLLQS